MNIFGYLASLAALAIYIRSFFDRSVRLLEM